MSNKILFFVKIFQNEKYLNDFISGKLFMNRLSYFQEIEGDLDDNRGDKHEGVLGWLQPDKVAMKFGDIAISPESLAGPVMIQMNHHKNLHVFCMYAGYVEDQENLDKTPEELLERIKLSEDCLNLGEFAAVIHNPREYMNRVKKAGQYLEYTGGAKCVEYYNPDTFHGSFPEHDVIFKKRLEYSHQKEYRIYLDTKTNDDNPYVLDIGDASDIVTTCKSADINSNFQVRTSAGKDIH